MARLNRLNRIRTRLHRLGISSDAPSYPDIEYLLVPGGGGGGCGFGSTIGLGGGGGGGNVQPGTMLAADYLGYFEIIVGAGGPGASTLASGSNGSDTVLAANGSTFDEAFGGGGGGAGGNPSGTVGVIGGGNGNDKNATPSVSSNGFSGGNAIAACGAAGGGAGAAGNGASASGVTPVGAAGDGGLADIRDWGDIGAYDHFGYGGGGGAFALTTTRSANTTGLGCARYSGGGVGGSYNAVDGPEFTGDGGGGGGNTRGGIGAVGMFCFKYPNTFPLPTDTDVVHDYYDNGTEHVYFCYTSGYFQF